MMLYHYRNLKNAKFFDAKETARVFDAVRLGKVTEEFTFPYRGLMSMAWVATSTGRQFWTAMDRKG